MKNVDIVIIGGGPAGLAAAIAAKNNKCKSVLILERDKELGGILNQCIHNGFGLHTFQEELTGPEYAARYIEQVKELNIEYKLNTMVIEINKQKQITAVNQRDGLFQIEAKAIILAMGCRERPRGALNIPGFRPAGIFSAGTAQRLVNREGYLPGREVVILGSGDIGLIMARRMTLEGAKVKVVAEIMPYSGGLTRNIVQCLDDFGIPLKLSHTLTEIQGKERVTGVTIARVDENRKPIPGTEEYYPCDTVLFSVGLIPENELSRGMGIALDPVTSGPVVNEQLETSMEGVYACGNVLHVHDLVDYVSEEAALAGEHAARYVTGESRLTSGKEIPICPGSGVRYTVPQSLSPKAVSEKTMNEKAADGDVTIRFRVDAIYKNAAIGVYFDHELVLKKRSPILTPGEMGQIKLSARKRREYPDLKSVTVKVEGN
ncbi:NADPH-dependent 2,4-dienoyl-CoA reductase/sulfur reductase-like enzyme [Anaerotaenia torta]|uniref:NAD(P)/FAD-dependent oxidoreductase n=1 Tax=Anaerotaenia torta TaxID=433293 RepID=UPI003D1C5034